MRKLLLTLFLAPIIWAQNTNKIDVQPGSDGKQGRIQFKGSGTTAPTAPTGSAVNIFQRNGKMLCKDAAGNDCWGVTNSAGTDVPIADITSSVTSVTDYGATGNGVTNDTTAIQAALTALGVAGGSLYFPNGTYLFSGLTIPTNINIICQNRNNTILLYAGSTKALQGPASLNNQISIQNCGITKQNAQGAIAISMQGIWNSQIINNTISNFNIGIDLDGTSYGSYFNQVSMNIIGTTATGINLTGGSGQGANSNTISDNRVTGATTGIKGVSGSNIVQGNLILRNDIEEFAAGTSYGIDYRGDNSLLTENWVETTCAGTCTGIYLRGSGNTAMSNKYALVGSGFTQINYDSTLANLVLELSTGSAPIYFFGDTTGAIQLQLKSTGPASLKLTNLANTSTNRSWSFVLGSSNKICLNELADDETTVLNAPACWDASGLFEQNRSMLMGGAGTEAFYFAKSADGAKQIQLGCQNSVAFCFLGSTTNTDVSVLTNSQETLKITATGNVQVVGNSGAGLLQLGTITFAALTSVTNGNLVYCSDCQQANPCTSGGSGAVARREAGAWNCAGSGGGGGGSYTFNSGTGTIASTVGTTITYSVDPATVPTFLTGATSIDFGSLNQNTCSTSTITVTGAVTGDAVAPGWPATLEAGLTGIMNVTAANTVTVTLCKITSGPVDPANNTFRATIVRSF